MNLHRPASGGNVSHVVFAGTPDFAARIVDAIHAAGHRVTQVLTQPDRPAGRGMKPQASPVKQWALAHDVPVFQPVTMRVRDKEGREIPDGVAAQARLRAIFEGSDAPTVMVVAAYGLILPQAVLDLPKRGCLNVHASLLPRWRGAAPIQRALEAGDLRTGVDIMRMEAGLDTGPVLLEHAIDILPDDTAGTLHDRLAQLGARAIVEALASLDRLVPRAQPDEGITYARKIEKHEAAIDFEHPADEVARRIRAFNPAPGAYATLVGAARPAETVKCWFARRIDMRHDTEPGTVLSADADGVIVACADTAVRLEELQRSGGKRLSAPDFLAGLPLRPGDRFMRAIV